jgi:ketosteroid isomerase-like protein
LIENVTDSIEQGQADWAESTALGDLSTIQLHMKTSDLALFNPAIDRKLRGCDSISLHAHDIAQWKGTLPRYFFMLRKTP